MSVMSKSQEEVKQELDKKLNEINQKMLVLLNNINVQSQSDKGVSIIDRAEDYTKLNELGIEKDKLNEIVSELDNPAETFSTIKDMNIFIGLLRTSIEDIPPAYPDPVFSAQYNKYNALVHEIDDGIKNKKMVSSENIKTLKEIIAVLDQMQTALTTAGITECLDSNKMDSKNYEYDKKFEAMHKLFEQYKSAFPPDQVADLIEQAKIDKQILVNVEAELYRGENQLAVLEQARAYLENIKKYEKKISNSQQQTGKPQREMKQSEISKTTVNSTVRKFESTDADTSLNKLVLKNLHRNSEMKNRHNKPAPEVKPAHKR